MTFPPNADTYLMPYGLTSKGGEGSIPPLSLCFYSLLASLILLFNVEAVHSLHQCELGRDSIVAPHQQQEPMDRVALWR
jgi:hypothetical protein